jgi:cytochrome c-type biogenesis protein CcmE
MAEQLHGMVIRDGTILVAVSSAGCTQSEQFRLDITDAGGRTEVTLVRTLPDFCKMAPMVKEIELKLPAELQSATFKVQNPFGKGPVWPPSE